MITYALVVRWLLSALGRGVDGDLSELSVPPLDVSDTHEQILALSSVERLLGSIMDQLVQGPNVLNT